MVRCCGASIELVGFLVYVGARILVAHAFWGDVVCFPVLAHIHGGGDQLLLFCLQPPGNGNVLYSLVLA